jgi:alkanesulfonate monooxygenase SsuD/methylene tetrahydromethanopterin reductase-like flavin-dependent oxidoreductase (luciferase family)
MVRMATSATGVVFPPRTDPATLPRFARRAEQLGFDSLWVIEDCFIAGGLTIAATALAVTERLRVGVGLMPVPLRNPALAAMEIGALGRMHPGRFVAVFGHGVPAWMEQVGALPPKRMAALRETTAAVRALLAGETVTVHGDHVHLDAVALDPAPQTPPPVLIGSTGPRGLALAGEVADGFLISEGATPGFLADCLAHARAGRARASASPDLPDRPLHAVAYTWLAVEDDEARARQRLRPAIDVWLDGIMAPAMYEAVGLRDRRLEPGPVPAKLAGEVSVAGPPAACADAVARRHAVGVDEVVLWSVGEDPMADYARFAAG